MISWFNFLQLKKICGFLWNQWYYVIKKESFENEIREKKRNLYSTISLIIRLWAVSLFSHRSLSLKMNVFARRPIPHMTCRSLYSVLDEHGHFISYITASVICFFHLAASVRNTDCMLSLFIDITNLKLNPSTAAILFSTNPGVEIAYVLDRVFQF